MWTDWDEIFRVSLFSALLNLELPTALGRAGVPRRAKFLVDDSAMGALQQSYQIQRDNMSGQGESF